jgi:hypothetical protein
MRGRFLAGKMDAQRFQEKLSGRWRSVALPGGRTFDGQPVGTTNEQIQTAIAQAKAEADHLIELGSDPYGWAWR